MCANADNRKRWVKSDIMLDYKAPSLLEDLILREKPAKILISLKTSKETNCTYSHTIKILDILKEQGLVEFEKSGRIKRVRLTSDGWDIAHNLEALTKKFEQIGDKVKKTAKPKAQKKSAKARKRR
jgi:predicted transcriptional regulator